MTSNMPLSVRQKNYHTNVQSTERQTDKCNHIRVNRILQESLTTTKLSRAMMSAHVINTKTRIKFFFVLPD